MTDQGNAAASTQSVIVRVSPDELDGGYIAEVRGLPGCVSEGETVGDALRNIADAYEAVIEVRDAT